MFVYVIAEHNNHQLSTSTQQVITAAKAFQQDIKVLVAGYNCKDVAEEAAHLNDIKSVIHIDDAAYEHVLAENFTVLIHEQLPDAQAILFGASTFGKDISPRLAALKDVAQISDVTKIVTPDTFERPIYAGNAIETVQSLDTLKVLTIRTTAFEACGSKDEDAPIEFISHVVSAKHTQFIQSIQPESSRPELGNAKRVVSGGRGLQSAEQFQLVETLADELGAAVGASRAAVDAGFISNDHQVGQTGKVIAPELYIALGISGAVQHLAGIKDAKVIVAINKDEDAPIFQVADYGLVADLFTAVPELIEALKVN